MCIRQPGPTTLYTSNTDHDIVVVYRAFEVFSHIIRQAHVFCLLFIHSHRSKVSCVWYVIPFIRKISLTSFSNFIKPIQRTLRNLKWSVFGNLPREFWTVKISESYAFWAWTVHTCWSYHTFLCLSKPCFSSSSMANFRTETFWFLICYFSQWKRYESQRELYGVFFHFLPKVFWLQRNYIAHKCSRAESLTIETMKLMQDNGK